MDLDAAQCGFSARCKSYQSQNNLLPGNGCDGWNDNDDLWRWFDANRWVEVALDHCNASEEISFQDQWELEQTFHTPENKDRLLNPHKYLPVKDLLSRLLGFLDELQASHAKLDGNFIVHFQRHKLVLLWPNMRDDNTEWCLLHIKIILGLTRSV